MSDNPISLSNINTDFEQLKAKLVAYLQTQDSWQNTLTSSTGNVITSITSYTGVSALLSIEAALKEAFPDTARSSKSILAIAKSIWGNHILRKKCANVTIDLTNNNSTSSAIAKFSQFTIAGYDYFNRESINVAANTTVSVTLYQGTVTSEQRSTSGTINEKFYIGSASNAFGISDDDLYCLVNGSEEYTKTTDGLYESGPNSLPIFYENSLPTGEVEILFGDGLYGKLPINNSTLSFIYVNTLGKAGNGVVTIGNNVTFTTLPNITGVTTTASANGADEKDPEYYRLNGASLRSAAVRGGGVTRPQYKALALGFPNVIDCNLLGQAETYPGDKAYMNVVTAIILADPLFDAGTFADFVAYMRDRTIDGLQFIQLDPSAVTSDITVSLYCTSKADPNALQITVQTALTALKTLKLGALGFSYYLSDIEKVIRDAIGDATLLDYFTLTTPSADLVVAKDEYVQFDTITVNSYYSTRELVTV